MHHILLEGLEPMFGTLSIPKGECEASKAFSHGHKSRSAPGRCAGFSGPKGG